MTNRKWQKMTFCIRGADGLVQGLAPEPNLRSRRRDTSAFTQYAAQYNYAIKVVHKLASI